MQMKKREKETNQLKDTYTLQTIKSLLPFFIFVERFVNMEIGMDLVLCIINNVRQSNNNNSNNLLFCTNNHVCVCVHTHTLYAPHTCVCGIRKSFKEKYRYTIEWGKKCIHDWPKCQQYDAITTELFYLKWSECWMCVSAQACPIRWIIRKLYCDKLVWK